MNTHPTYSEIIYLLADKFCSQRSKFISYDLHPSGEKITSKPLAIQMILGALVYLVKNKYVNLVIKDVKKLFIFPGQDVFMTQNQKLSANVTGIERRIFNNINVETCVNHTVYNLLSEDDSSPWGQIINICKKSLLDQKYLIAGEKKIFSAQTYIFDQAKLEEVSKMQREVSEALKLFERDTKLFQLTEKAVIGGMNSRVEHDSSVDLD